MADTAAAAADIADEDRLRAEVYGLLATALARPPSPDLLQSFAGLHGDETPLGQGVGALARISKLTTHQKVEREFHNLFIGLGRGELLPYASYYMTGFLNEKPLAKLRNDMIRIGVERADEVKEPEDNIASLMEIMQGMILGAFRAPAGLGEQRDFFNTHVSPWAGHFFSDLEGAKASVFYAPIGTIGRQFMDIERTAFRMEA
jgi:TorA maturation chaperone TorD